MISEPGEPLGIDVEVTADDIEAAVLTGASGAQLVEAAVHTALDRMGCPRAGREVVVGTETITVTLPAGWR